MAESIGDIAVRVGADITSLKKGMGDAASSVETFSQKAGQSLTSFSGNLLKFGAAAASAGALAAGALIKSSIDSADALSKMSKTLGLSVEKLSALQYAAGLSGIENEALSASLGKLNKNARDAYLGVGAAKDAFDALGITVANSAGNLRTNDEIFAQIVDKFSKMPNGIEKSAFAMDIFGKSGAALIPLLNEGTQGLGKLTAEADRLGVIVGSETAAAAEQFNDNLDKMKSAVQGLGLKMATEALPALNEFTNTINDPATQAGLSAISAGIVKVGASAVGALSEFMAFSRFIGEELARTLHGAANDDIAGLEDRLRQLQAQTDPKNFADWMSNSNMGDMFTGKGQLLQEIEDVKKKIQAAYSATAGIAASNPQAASGTGPVKIDEDDSISRAKREEDIAKEKEKRDEKAKNDAEKLEEARQKIADKELSSALEKESAQMAAYDREAMRKQADLDSIKARYITEEELDRQHREIMAVIGEEYNVANFETEAQWMAVKEQAEADHLSRVTELNRSAYSGIQKIIETSWGKNAASTAGSFKSILNTMASGSRKAFEISKAWALADAVVSTAQGIAKGVAAGYPAAIPLVAAAAATGFAQISAIRNQKFGGAGGAAAAGNGTPAEAPNPIGVGGGGGSGGRQSNQTLTVAPIDPNAIFSGAAMMGFGQQVYNFTKDGGKVVFGQ
jgi:hypothetical protein